MERVNVSHVVVQVKLTVLSDPQKVSAIVPQVSKYATGREWMARFRREEVRTYATRQWNELKGTGGRRLKNLRDLVELLKAAAMLGEPPQKPLPFE